MNYDTIIAELREVGLIHGDAPRITELSGGVSCDIVLIDDGRNRVVVKRALAKLRVKADWYADVDRNRYEQAYIDYVSQVLPDAVPRIVHRAPDAGWFAMEYFGDEFVNFKQMLLEGHADEHAARRAGDCLGVIHRRSWHDRLAAETFNTDKNFHDLRLEPYLLHTAEKHPALAKMIRAEARRLASVKICLVHGDYSPKNMLIGPRHRLVILDSETAWFGDPCFDAAFLLNHFMLKALFHHGHHGAMLQLARCAFDAYLKRLADDQKPGIGSRTARLLPMLMLARIDGKSPAEYLTLPDQHERVRRFAHDMIPQRIVSISQVVDAWRAMLVKA